ncbi:S8 family serine peptidase [Chloroflexota bacterium]
MIIAASMILCLPVTGQILSDGGEEINFPYGKPLESENSKLDSQLNQLVFSQKLRGSENFTLGTRMEVENGKVRVAIECAPEQVDAAIEAAIAMGADIETSRRNPFQVMLPVESLTALADAPSISHVGLPQYAQTFVTSQGVGLINADDWQSAGFNGAGVKIAILDGVFIGYQSLLGTELPASVTIKNFHGVDTPAGMEAGTIHGTACAEVVYDIAPGAQYWLVKYSTNIEFLDAVDYLIAQGVDVVSHSAGSPVWGPGTGSVCAKVDQARAAGIIWSQATGNYGQRHWQGS